METIRAVGETIQNYLTNESEDDAEVVAALEELDGVEINVDLLTSTAIGKTVSKLAKDKRSPEVVSAAKRLQAKWKSIVNSSVKAGKNENKRKREESSSESPAAQKRKTNHVKEEKKVPKAQPKKEEKKMKKRKKKRNKKQYLQIQRALRVIQIIQPVILFKRSFVKLWVFVLYREAKSRRK